MTALHPGDDRGKRGARVLVCAADPELRLALESALSEEQRPITVAPEALTDPARLLDVGVAVVGLSGGPDELERLARLRSLPAAQSLILVASGGDENALRAALERWRPLRALSWPCPPLLVQHAVHSVLPERPGEGARPKQRPATTLLGVSSAIHGLLDQVRQAGPTRVPVLILGETGTGKELVARAIHEQSSRAGKPFVPVNCGALPDSLLESELFGHERGAFTGAARAKRGLFEQADGGTLFLDEVGDTSSALQVKLLRALESGEIRRVGSTEARRVDVRLVSATHRDLEAAATDGGFRQDLLYRMNTLTLTLPPLRRRRVDIPFLAQHFAEEFGEAEARRITLDEDFLEALAQHDFPGNVRELRNAVERAIALAAPGEPVTAGHLPEGFGQSGTDGGAVALRGTLRERIEQVEIAAIREALDLHDGNRTRSAETLGLSRLGLRKKMQRLGLS